MKKIAYLTSLIILTNSLYGDCFGCKQNYCAKGYGKACYDLGLMYENGFIKKDRFDANSKRVCSVVDSLYSDANCANYDNKNPNFKIAASNYKKAISYKNVDALVSLGILHIKGKGVAKNYKKAKSLFKSACYKGNENGCFNYRLLIAKGF